MIVVVVSHDDDKNDLLILTLLLFLLQTRLKEMRLLCDVNNEGVKEYSSRI